ncbi:MAG: protein kinase, partial [Planctomycetota bacterium]|nr:protein kinase [Planctomycetota bacterium]
MLMHPSHDKLSGFVLGTLDDRQADVISQHLEVCADCESTMRELDKVSDTIIGELQQGLNGSFHAEPGYQKMLASIDAIGAESWPGSRDEGVSPDGVDEPAQAELQSVGVYEVLSKLGDGGMGTVYRAFHTKLKREVALKVLRPDRLRTSEAITRFEREMEAVGKLDHPNIVRATDAGEVDGGYFLVMELLAGIDLSKLAARCGPLGSADACELVRQAAVGLQHAHLHGLVHRDIKPSNLMLTVGQVSNLPSTGETSGRLEPCPTVKILDLGLA